ncbi:LysR family transcriptional regulator [Caballeronia sp. dw_19]|uniref:LysR family transcriptional regulator n=1 Tax=Caballeronia sp. dw_19 TaxID=2719791 RepID=UPI001BD1EF56|nr:LysR family transcriptional regulator [Caballeronia sp. dw_19]
MDRLQAMEVFIRVVDTNSFTKAADTLNLPRASVTNIIQNLESYLKVRLLQRTTRRLSLTADGTAYYERCVKVLAEIEEIEGSFSTTAMTPRGKLRVDTSGPIGKMILVPALDDFHAKYPNVQLTIGLSDRRVDMIEEGVDCTIRVGALLDSNMVARHLNDFHFLTAATPGYLKRFGVPISLEDLDKHVAVKYISARTSRPMELHFVVEGEEIEVKIPGAFTVNDAEAHLAVGLKGFGLFQIARMLALPYLRTGELVEVLPQWKPATMETSLVYPQNRHQSPAMRAFINWTLELCAAHPLLAGPA